MSDKTKIIPPTKRRSKKDLDFELTCMMVDLMDFEQVRMFRYLQNLRERLNEN